MRPFSARARRTGRPSPRRSSRRPQSASALLFPDPVQGRSCTAPPSRRARRQSVALRAVSSGRVTRSPMQPARSKAQSALPRTQGDRSAPLLPSPRPSRTRTRRSATTAGRRPPKRIRAPAATAPREIHRRQADECRGTASRSTTGLRTDHRFRRLAARHDRLAS